MGHTAYPDVMEKNLIPLPEIETRLHGRSVRSLVTALSLEVRLEVLTAVTVKITVFWDVTPCSLMCTDVTDESAAAIFTVSTGRNMFIKLSADLRIYQSRRRYLPEDILSVQLHAQ